MHKKCKILAPIFVALMFFNSAHAMKRKAEDTPKNPEKKQKTSEVTKEIPPDDLPFAEEARHLSGAYENVLAQVFLHFDKLRKTIPHGHHMILTAQANAKLEDYFHLEPPEFYPLWHAFLKSIRDGMPDITDRDLVAFLTKVIPDHLEDNIMLMLSSDFFQGYKNPEDIDALLKRNAHINGGVLFIHNESIFWKQKNIGSDDIKTKEIRFFEDRTCGAMYIVKAGRDAEPKEIDIEDFYSDMTMKGFRPPVRQ